MPTQPTQRGRDRHKGRESRQCAASGGQQGRRRQYKGKWYNGTAQWAGSALSQARQGRDSDGGTQE